MATSRAPIKIGTDCSGMEAPIQAIRNLKVSYDHKFSCDVNPHARSTIEANFPHDIMYHDLTERDNTKAPNVDIYVAGFPCQPFSSAGLQQGFKDRRGRGEIFFYVLDYIAHTKPRVFILENVSGLVRIQGGKYLKAVLEELENLGLYNIKWQILDTKQHGVPHYRKRWYCVGILKEFDTGAFTFPEPIACPSIENFLERRNSALAATGLPPASASTARANVIRFLKTLRRKGIDGAKSAWIADVDSTAERSKMMDSVSPCITCSRGAGHWVTNRGRRLTKEEQMRLQGMNPTAFKVAVSESQLGRQIGNTMSVNVLERLFVQILPAAKLAAKGELKDRWANGRALEVLSATRGQGFMAYCGPKTPTGRPTRKRQAVNSTESPAKRARK